MTRHPQATRRSLRSPNWPPARTVGWAQPMGVNGAERSTTAVYCTRLTCRNAVSAGQPASPGKVDTEVVAQPRRTAVNGVEPQVGGVIEGDHLPCLFPEHFSVTEVRSESHDRIVRGGNFLRDHGPPSGVLHTAGNEVVTTSRVWKSPAGHR
jgi:hypothetical protein